MENAEVTRILKLLDSLMSLRKVRRTDLARYLGMTSGHLWRVFNGDLELRYRLVLEILDFLKIPPLAFFQIAYEDKNATTDLLAARLSGLGALEEPRIEPMSKTELRQLVTETLTETLEQLGVLDLLDQRGQPPPTPKSPPPSDAVDPSPPPTSGPSPKKPSRRRKPPQDKGKP